MREFITPQARAFRLTSVLIVTLLFAVTASAYTVVMRGGRRVEIPSRFVVTEATLTYEVSQGIQVTLAMAAIDIQATENANKELPGSLLRRAQVRATAPTAKRGTRTITNQDLETSMRRRRESEVAYEARRKQLGLPTLEESRKRIAVIPDLAGTELERKLVGEQESEHYWRARASALRTEISALDAELAYIRARIEEVPFSGGVLSSATATALVPFISFGSVGGGHSFPGSRGRRPPVFGPSRATSQLSGRVRFGGGMTRGQVFLNPGRFPNRRQLGGVSNWGFPGGTTPGFVVQPYDFSYERSELITHFNELATTRAGLNARWRELEDEARRAGAQPGWLRR